MNAGNSTVVIYSYAKVNLTLDVLGKRSDGYHAIESVMQSVSLHDRISLHVGGDPGIRVACDMPGIPTDESNLAHKAASEILNSRGISTGVDIRIDKRIPPEAGLGGGSSNAAAVLRGLDYLLDLGIDQLEVCDLAARVGSDVPFFLSGGTAFVCGRGEAVRPLPDIDDSWLVIVKPAYGVSTAWAYRRLDEIRPVAEESLSASQRMVEHIEAGGTGTQSLSSLLHNDLEQPAIEQHPEISEIKASLLRAGASGALMCGSGSAVFGLFKREDEARRAAGKLESDMGQSFVARTVNREEFLRIEPGLVE